MFSQNWFTGFGPEKFEPRMERIYTDGKARCYARSSHAGSSEPNSVASELADAPVSELLTRPRVAPLFRALREVLGIWETKLQGCDWLAKRGDFLGKHPKACLRVIFQNSSSIRPANQA